MKKKLAILILLSATNVHAATDTIDVQFKGTLINPTCTASFTGTSGTEIQFGTIRASDFASKADGAVISQTAEPASINFTGCGGGVANVTLQFIGGDTSGYGFSGKSTYFKSGSDNSRLGMALFKNATANTVAEAIDMASSVPSKIIPLSSLEKSGSNYAYNVYARIVVSKANNDINKSIGNLTATGQVVVGYQ